MSSGDGRVAVTGMGAVTALGLSLSDSWRRLVEGKSGIGPITLFDSSDLLTRIAAEVSRELQAISDRIISKKNLKQMNRVGQFAFASSNEAVIDSGLDLEGLNKDRCAVIIGASNSGYSSNDAANTSNYILRSMINSLSAWISLSNGFKGPNFTVNTACASSGYAIALAYNMIVRGEADVVIAGGTDSMISREGISGFNELLALSENNDALEKACKPFDKNRDGFVMGEGAGAIVMESLDNAKKRGARIYCELLGYSLTSESFNIVAPERDGVGMAKTIRKAIESSGLEPGDVDYINAHGTATYLNDIYETKAIKAVFGERAREIPISASKSMIGHTLGAAGVLGAIITIKSIEEGIITPTINYEEPDPDCDLDYVPNKSIKRPVKIGISNSFGFGGHNSVLVFRKHD